MEEMRTALTEELAGLAGSDGDTTAVIGTTHLVGSTAGQGVGTPIEKIADAPPFQGSAQQKVTATELLHSVTVRNIVSLFAGAIFQREECRHLRGRREHVVDGADISDHRTREVTSLKMAQPVLVLVNVRPPSVAFPDRVQVTRSPVSASYRQNLATGSPAVRVVDSWPGVSVSTLQNVPRSEPFDPLRM